MKESVMECKFNKANLSFKGDAKSNGDPSLPVKVNGVQSHRREKALCLLVDCFLFAL